jgi:hypothetical protein
VTLGQTQNLLYAKSSTSKSLYSLRGKVPRHVAATESGEQCSSVEGLTYASCEESPFKHPSMSRATACLRYTSSRDDVRAEHGDAAVQLQAPASPLPIDDECSMRSLISRNIHPIPNMARRTCLRGCTPRWLTRELERHVLFHTS